MTSRARFLCLDCKNDTGKMREYYFLHTDLWLRVTGSDKGMLCIGCFEKRLGRRLTSADFTGAYINRPDVFEHSTRLLSRLTSVE